MNLYTINTGYFKLDGGAMFGVVPKSMWNKLNPADENNMPNSAIATDGIMAKEFCILFIAHAIINQYQPVALLYQ